MKIASKVSDICIKSTYPHFKYRFGKAGIPLEVDSDHSEKILMNDDFYESDKEIPIKKVVKKKQTKKITWEEELSNLFNEKEVTEILKSYSTKGELLESLEKENPLKLQEDIAIKLEQEFIS